MCISNIHNVDVKHNPDTVLTSEAQKEYSYMDIIISNASGEPIYSQIVAQIKTMILEGQLKEGDALPSMRNLAMQLRISVITTNATPIASSAEVDICPMKNVSARL